MTQSVKEFLALLDEDMAAHADAMQPLSPDLAARIAVLTIDVPTNPAAKIDGIVTL